MIVGKDAVETRVGGVASGVQGVFTASAKGWQYDAELHESLSKAISAAPMAPERGPNIEVLTVIAGRLR